MDTESRYAPIEGEALVVADALEKCRMFVLMCPNLTIVCDHKPLIRILGDKSLENITNIRLFSFKERTLPSQFEIKYAEG